MNKEQRRSTEPDARRRRVSPAGVIVVMVALGAAVGATMHNWAIGLALAAAFGTGYLLGRYHGGT